MSELILGENKHSQLEEVLHSLIMQLDASNQALALLKAKQLLRASGHHCLVVPTSVGGNKLKNITRLYKSLAVLKDIQRQLLNEDSSLSTSLIGIYPSLEYPACVYELNTNADNYVSGNVLPHAGAPIIGIIKYLMTKLLGVSPAVGALGLVLHLESETTE